MAKRAYGTLDRAQVLDAALVMVDRDGIEAFSMRRLAAEIGAGTMSLYRHVRDREEVLDLVAERLALLVEVPQGDPQAWRGHLHDLLASLRSVAHAHPRAFPLLALRPLVTEAALQRTSEAVALLEHAGRGPQRTATAARALVSFATGYILAEVSGRTQLAGEHTIPDAGFRDGIDLMLGAPRDRDAGFHEGIDMLLDGFVGG